MTPRDLLALQILLARGCTAAEAYAAADAWLTAKPTLHQHEYTDLLPGRALCACGAVREEVASAP